MFTVRKALISPGAASRAAFTILTLQQPKQCVSAGLLPQLSRAALAFCSSSRKFNTKTEVPPALQGGSPMGWTPPPEPEQPKRKHKLYTPSGLREYYLEKKNTIVAYAIIGAAGLTTFMVIKGGIDIANFFASTNFYDVAKVSFFTGLMSGGVLAVIANLVGRSFTVRPELVYKAAVKKVLKDKRVQAELGSNVQTGKFRAYSITDGGARVLKGPQSSKRVYYGWQRYYEPKKVQMIFQLQGTKGVGMISCDATKDFSNNVEFESLALDVLGTGKRVIIIGDTQDERIYKGMIQLR